MEALRYHYKSTVIRKNLFIITYKCITMVRSHISDPQTHPRWKWHWGNKMLLYKLSHYENHEEPNSKELKED